MSISVIIPALNEEEPIAEVVRAVLATGIPREVIVVDNGSTDRTAERARAAGARVVERAARLRSRLCDRSRCCCARVRHAGVSGWRWERLRGIDAAARAADPGRRTGFRDRLAHARRTRAREHELAASLRRLSRRLAPPSACTA